MVKILVQESPVAEINSGNSRHRYLRRRRHPAKHKHHPAKKTKRPKKRPSASQPAPVKTQLTPAKPASPPDSSSFGVLLGTSRERLFLNRLGTGFTQRSLAQLRSSGTPEAWLERQLAPASVAEGPKVGAIDAWFSCLKRTAAAKWADSLSGARTMWQDGHDLGNWTLLRRIYSERAVLETMVDFWSTNLHVPITHDRAWIYRYDYDATIRRHALGTFTDLLIECALHPAMRVYLDNWLSVRGQPNENQGRELLELHTVGRGAGYTEQMVKDSAAILSGYTVDWGKSFGGVYSTAAHTTGRVTVLEFTHENASTDGRGVAIDYLTYLAHHPATAHSVAQKIATYFVSDNPSPELVDTLAKSYLDSGTSIPAVLRTLAAHPEFLTSEGRKVRTPYDDLVATARVLDVDVQPPTGTYSWANQANYLHGADRLFSWSRPDGAPITAPAWSSATRVISSFVMHQLQAGGWRPSEANYKSRSSWMPVASLRFDAYVDHLARAWLGRSSNVRILEAACQATALSPSTIVRPSDAVGGWLFDRLAGALLDSPDHMTT
jgi:hypothetical protein